PPGRGAILMRFGEGDDALVVVMMHLALGTKARTRQLGKVASTCGASSPRSRRGEWCSRSVAWVFMSPMST
ncbi:EEP domain-containing protein, partial [Pseudomonas otitidis]|nr:EEP domain-containing protein [Pseudomonas otitidis]